jgi:hypothetical protein
MGDDTEHRMSVITQCRSNGEQFPNIRDAHIEVEMPGFDSEKRRNEARKALEDLNTVYCTAKRLAATCQPEFILVEGLGEFMVLDVVEDVVLDKLSFVQKAQVRIERQYVADRLQGEGRWKSKCWATDRWPQTKRWMSKTKRTIKVAWR